MNQQQEEQVLRCLINLCKHGTECETCQDELLKIFKHGNIPLPEFLREARN